MEIVSPTNPLATPPATGGAPAPSGATNGSGSATSPDSSSSAPATPAVLGENALHVEISDALSEKEKVKFTVHTRTTLPGFTKKDNNVVRQHEEFVWLHDRIEENDDYAGYIVSYRVKSLTRC